MVKPLGRHVQYSVTFAVTEDQFEPRPGRVRLLKKIISNNSYAHDDQGDNPGQENSGLGGRALVFGRCAFAVLRSTCS